MAMKNGEQSVITELRGANAEIDFLRAALEAIINCGKARTDQCANHAHAVARAALAGKDWRP